MINKMSSLSKYNRLRKKLKSHFKSAAEIGNAMYEVGKMQGLSNERIRSDIESDLKDVIKDRRLREIMPQALKRPYNKALPNLVINTGSKSNSVTITPPPPPPPLSKLTLKERKKLPEIVACEQVVNSYKIIAQDMIDYITDKDDP
jgi:hypothetical protein